MSIEFKVESYHRPYMVDQGVCGRMVQYKAYRVVEPTIFGYGMTPDSAVCDLVRNVRPFFDEGSFEDGDTR